MGIAGAARAMTPEEMRPNSHPSPRCSARSARACCTTRPARPSTAHPHIGSIGAAVARCAAPSSSPGRPSSAASPNLGRYCLFGNLFAAAGAAARCSASTATRR
jgi:hypothetical protein